MEEFERDLKKLKGRLEEQDKSIKQLQDDLLDLKKKVDDNEYLIYQLQSQNG